MPTPTTEVTSERPHISPTQLNMMVRCGEQYRRRYLERDVLPPGIALAKGRAIHASAEQNYRQKIDTRRDLPTQEAAEIAAAAFQREVKQGIELSAQESLVGKDKTVGQAKDATVGMAVCQIEDIAPRHQPVYVEQTVRLPMAGGRDLLGIIDLADDQGCVVDLKTSKRKKRQEDADSSLQLTVYCLLYHHLTGQSPTALQFDVVVQTKTKVAAQFLTTKRNAADITTLANRINAFSRSLDAGIFQPAPPDAWWCSAKWCGYARTCPYYSGRE